MNHKKAIFYMLISVLSFAFMNVLVKYLSHFNVYQMVFFRSIGTLAFTLPMAVKNKIPVWGTHKKWLILRGILGVISLTCYFESLHYLAVGTAVSLRYTSPIFAAIFAVVFLSEKMKPLQWMFILLAFLGVFIIKGFAVEINIWGLIWVLLSAVFMGLVFVILRKIGSKEHPLVIINYFMVMAFIIGGLMSISQWKSPSSIEWILLLSLGFFGFFGQLYMTRAFQSEETSLIAPFKYLEVVFTILLGAIGFAEIYNFWTLLGVFLIMFSVIGHIYVKNKQ